MKKYALNTKIHCLFLVSLLLIACSFSDPEEYSNTPGVILAFDDASFNDWRAHFDLFDKYDARVVFFISHTSNVNSFMLEAQERGHEVAFHTLTHPDLRTVSREQFFEETISRIDTFREGGVELNSFAYPFGAYHQWMHEELLKHYNIVRTTGGLRRYTKEALRFGVVHSAGIDNIAFRSEERFRNFINTAFAQARHFGTITVLHTHRIQPGVHHDWSITPERLEFVLQAAQEHGLTFYTFKCFQ